MNRTLIGLIILMCLMASCRSTRKIQTAIAKKDTLVVSGSLQTHADSVAFMKDMLGQLEKRKLDFTTFSAKINVDYESGDGKKYDVNANLRMYKDSVIWISITAILGVEALRAYITKDSVKLLNKQDKIYTARSVSYLQELTALPLDLHTLQDIIMGNPVFIDSNLVSYSTTENSVSILNIGEWFKNLVTLSKTGRLENSKLDDVNVARSRTCNLTYDDYEHKEGVEFASKRRITITEKSRLDIKLNFKQYGFNETLSFPFPIPKNYTRD